MRSIEKTVLNIDQLDDIDELLKLLTQATEDSVH